MKKWSKPTIIILKAEELKKLVTASACSCYCAAGYGRIDNK